MGQKKDVKDVCPDKDFFLGVSINVRNFNPCLRRPFIIAFYNVFRSYKVFINRAPYVRQIKTAEDAMPVSIVALCHV